jgi:hypothetical protein
MKEIKLICERKIFFTITLYIQYFEYKLYDLLLNVLAVDNYQLLL